MTLSDRDARALRSGNGGESMRRCVFMAVAFFVSLLVPALHADSLDYLLANCGRACGSLPGSVTVTLTCQQRKWQIAAIESSSREAAVTDESLDSLSTLTTLDQLALGSSSWHLPDNYTGMTPKAFRLLSTLQLRRLSLSGNVTGDDLKDICLLGSLEDLGLVGCCRGQMVQDDVTSLYQCSCRGGGAGQLVSETRHIRATTCHTTESEYD